MNKEKLSTVCYLTVTILAGVILFAIGIKYVFAATLPFIIAWAMAFFVRPVAAFLSAHLHLPERPTRAALSLLALSALGSLLVFLVLRVGTEIVAFFSGIGENEKLLDIISGILDPPLGKLGDGEIFAELEEKLSSAIGDMISSLISGISGYITAFVSRIPGVFIFLVTLIIASVYFAYDLERINASVRRVLPPKIEKSVVSFKEKTLKTALVYFRSYLILMLMTFGIILAGLLILRVKYALMLAVVIALLDVLPVIGVGTVLIPWSVFCFISSDARLGIGLLVLFAVNALIRQFAEPKIVGRSLGMHPLLTLVLLYFGYSFLGIAGILLMPVFAVVLKSLLEKDKTADINERTA